MLTKLKLHQFKRFKECTIELFPLTLLTGINGMGKSSVVQALMVLRQSFDRGELQNNGKIVIEDKDLINLITPDDMLCADADDSEVSILVSDDIEATAEWSMIADGDSNTLSYKYKKNEGDIYKSPLFSKTFQYLNAERIGPRVTYDRLTISRPHSPIGYRGEFVANRILELVNNLEQVELEKVIINGGGKNIYDLLSIWVSEIIYPGTRVSIDGSDSSKIDLKYTFKEQPNKTFNPINIGFGFSYALPVIVAILTAKPGSILIVENPEAHLHPRGQSRMGRLLGLAAESGVQIIIETHSDHLLNGVRVAVKQKQLSYNKTQIHFFTNRQPNTPEFYKISFSIEEDGELERWPEGFFDEWDNMLTELLK